MNSTYWAWVIGIGTFALGVIGIMSPETRLLGIINTDFIMNTMRMGLGAVLIMSSVMGEESEKIAFALLGIAYIANLIVAFISPTMFGLLPNGYGAFDTTMHLGLGLFAFWIALKPITHPQLKRIA